MAMRDNSTTDFHVLDKDRSINGKIFDEEYFEHLISEMEEIRVSKRNFYQKITDIYATAADYALDSQITTDFYKAVLDKMQYALCGKPAAKNDLPIQEIQELNEIVTMYLDYATRQAKRHIPMTMADWAAKFDVLLQFDDDPFYSKDNMERLHKSVWQMEATGGTIHEVNVEN